MEAALKKKPILFRHCKNYTEEKKEEKVVPYLHGLNSKTTIINFFLLLKLLPIILFL